MTVLQTIFEKERQNIEEFIQTMFRKAPLTADYKKKEGNHLFYQVPIMKVMEHYLAKIDEEVPMPLIYLKKTAATCFWIINKYEDDMPIDYYDIKSMRINMNLQELENMEMDILKKIEYRIYKFIPNKITGYIKPKNTNKSTIKPPHMMKTYKENGRPPLYIKPRSLSVDFTNNLNVIRPNKIDVENTLPPEPPIEEEEEEVIHKNKRRRSSTY
jgi:hypothetical protein